MILLRSLAVLAVGTIVAAFSPARAQDAAAGETVFKRNCAICHSPVAGKNMVGPSLFGIVGREAGTVPGFHYSAANKNSGITWTPEKLDSYLANPKAIVPGTIMTFAGLKDAQQRADLIAYLATLK